MKLSFAVLLVCANAVFAAVGPSSTPTRIIAGSGVTVVTNSAASFTISASGLSALNQNQFDNTSTNIKSGVTLTNVSASVVTNSGAFLGPAGSASAPTYSFSATPNYGMYYAGFGQLAWTIAGIPQIGLESSVLNLWTSHLGYGTGFGGTRDTMLSRSAAGVLEVNSGTVGTHRDLRLRTLLAYAQPSDPASSATFGQVYAKTNGATTEVYVMDGAGNVTQISPHARASSPAPASVDAGDKTPIVIHHKNLFTGEQEWLHLSAMARKLEQLTGEKFVWKRRIPDAEVRDWDAEQARIEAESDDDVKADRKRLREWERSNALDKGAAPTVREKYRRAPKPDFLK